MLYTLYSIMFVSDYAMEICPGAHRLSRIKWASRPFIISIPIRMNSFTRVIQLMEIFLHQSVLFSPPIYIAFYLSFGARFQPSWRWFCWSDAPFTWLSIGITFLPTTLTLDLGNITLEEVCWGIKCSPKKSQLKFDLLCVPLLFGGNFTSLTFCSSAFG